MKINAVYIVPIRYFVFIGKVVPENVAAWMKNVLDFTGGAWKN